MVKLDSACRNIEEVMGNSLKWCSVSLTDMVAYGKKHVRLRH